MEGARINGTRQRQLAFSLMCISRGRRRNKRRRSRKRNGRRWWNRRKRKRAGDQLPRNWVKSPQWRRPTTKGHCNHWLHADTETDREGQMDKQGGIGESWARKQGGRRECGAGEQVSVEKLSSNCAVSLSAKCQFHLTDNSSSLF